MFQSLNPDLAWKAGDFQTFFTILVSIGFFTIYWFIFVSKKIKDYFYKKYEFDVAAAKHILFTKYAGFTLMGVFPTILALIFLPHISLADYGLTIIPETTLTSLAWIIGISIIIVPVTMKSAKQPKNLVNYPQIRTKIWTKKLIIHNALGWAFYLFGYEFLFRGVLFIPLIESMGLWPAIAVNIALYSATHIPKGMDETIGAAVLGLVLCLLTVYTGTIWIAFLVHLAMAWTNSFTALKHNPEMKFAGQ